MLRIKRESSKGHPGKFFETLERREMFSAGALDTSFSVDGKATLDFFPPTGVNVRANDVAVQGDGKTVVVGNSSDGKIAIARANFDGTPDTNFGSGTGAVSVRIRSQIGGAIDTTDPDNASAVAIDGNGNIVVAGFVGYAVPQLFVARFLPSGALDPSFHNGEVQTDDGIMLGAVADVKIDAGDKIVVAGTNNSDMFVARFNTNGSLDGSFGDSGRRSIDFGANDSAQSLAIDTHGSATTNPFYGTIAVVGSRFDNGDDEMAIARLTAGGNLDNRFSGDGRATIKFGNNTRNEANGVLIQSGGRIVVAGVTDTSLADHTHADFALARLNANGTTDSTFGGFVGPLVKTDLGGQDIANDIIESSDGSLIVGGSTKVGSGAQQFGIAKYSANGVLDVTFGNIGIVRTDFTSSGINNASVARLASGPGLRFVATGGVAFATARYLDKGANQVFAQTILTTASEAHSQPVSFFVFREERLPVTTRVYFNVSGTATAPSLISSRFKTVDYGVSGMSINALTGTTGYVDIPAGQTFTLVTLTPVDDARIEGSETATFNIASNARYEIGNPSSVTITIQDNDFPPRQIVASAPTLATTAASPMAVVSSTTSSAAVTGGGTVPGGDLILEAKKRRKPR